MLLKDKGGILPLTGIKSIAVIGDDAGAAASVQATNSVVPIGNRLSVPSDAIASRAGTAIKVVYEKGTMGIGPLPAIPASAWHPASGQGQGLTGTYYKQSGWAGEPVATQTDRRRSISMRPLFLPSLRPLPQAQRVPVVVVPVAAEDAAARPVSHGRPSGKERLFLRPLECTDSA